MLDYVWICRDGDNEELRYSIRSVVKNMPPGNIWVVGGKPAWYIGNHIPVKQDSPKMQNAIKNLKTICDSRQISENFVLMNDDFFVVKPVKEVRTYNGGPLIDKIGVYEDYHGRSPYTMSLQETYHGLLKMGVSNPIDYELHVPMPMSKSGLSRALKRSYLFRSTYGNLYVSESTEIRDVKVYAHGAMALRSYNYPSMEYDYVSSNDDSFEYILNDILVDMFPTPSLFENTRSPQ